MAAGDDIVEIQPGQMTDKVESLARAIQDSSLAAAKLTGFVPTDENDNDQGDFDSLSDLVKEFRLEQARVLLALMNR